MDLIIISGKFFEVKLPKEKMYLTRYYTTDLQLAFLKYMHVCGEWRNFVDHTGMYCAKRTMQVFSKRLKDIEDLHRKAKQDLDFEKLELIESGNIPMKDW